MSTFKALVHRVMGSREKTEEAQVDLVRTERILVVDGIDVNRIIVVKIFNTLGAECDTAVNGLEAVEQFEACQSSGT